MECMQTRWYLAKIRTSDSNILNAWNLLVDTLTLVEIGCVEGLPKYLEEILWSQYITIITSPGKRNISIEIFGSYEKGLHLLSRVKKGLLAALWEIYRLYLRGDRRRNQNLRSIRQSMERVVQWEELRHTTYISGCRQHSQCCTPR